MTFCKRGDKTKCSQTGSNVLEETRMLGVKTTRSFERRLERSETRQLDRLKGNSTIKVKDNSIVREETRMFKIKKFKVSKVLSKSNL